MPEFQLNTPATAACSVTTNPAAASPSVPPLSQCQEIACEWLTRALQVFDGAIGAVEAFQSESFCESDFDCTVKLTLSYAPTDRQFRGRIGPTRLLCKVAKPLPAPHWGEFIEDVCHRETAAYRELKHHHVCRVPTLYFSVTDKQRCTFLLEDLGASPMPQQTLAGQVNKDQLEKNLGHLQPAMYSQIDAVLRELALLHGCFARHSPVSAPAWLIRPRAMAELIGQRYRQGLSRLQDCSGQHFLSDEYRQLLETFSPLVVAWHRYDRHIFTITHGDMRSDNMLYQQLPTGRGVSCHATLMGWKLAGLRNPMFDVASLLSNSLPVALRRANEGYLLERYRRQFEQSGIQYASLEARQDYRFHLFAPLIFNVCSAAFLGDAVSQNRSLLDNISRNCQAILDWDAMAPLKVQLQQIL